MFNCDYAKPPEVYTNFYVKSCSINYGQVPNKDHRLLIEKCLKVIFPKDHHLIKGEISPLSGGKSEDNLYVGTLGKHKLVFRIMTNLDACRKQCAYSEMVGKIQLGPNVIYQNVEDGIFVTEFIEGTPLHPHLLENTAILLQVAHALFQIHHSQSPHDDLFDVYKNIEFKLDYFIRHDAEFSKKLENFLEYVRQIKSAIAHRKSSFAPCHNDIHMNNVFFDHQYHIKFIDWGDAGLGDPFFDLARASVEFHLSATQAKLFLEEYFSNNLSSADYAHFYLMQLLVLLKIGLKFLELDQLDPTTKERVISFFKKIESNLETENINHPKDVSKIIFKLIEENLQSEKFNQALLTLQQLQTQLAP